jgi:hypothetical protein
MLVAIFEGVGVKTGVGIGLGSGAFDELVLIELKFPWLSGKSSGEYCELASKNVGLVVELSIWLERRGKKQIASIVQIKKITSSLRLPILAKTTSLSPN